MKKRVLCLLFPGFEEVEAVAPIDLLRRAGVDVVVASVNGEKLVSGRCQITLQADTTLQEVMDEEFDLMLIPGGPGVKGLREDGRPARLAKRFWELGKPVAAICAAPTVLLDAGLLEGKRFTSHAGVVAELPRSLQDERVVEDNGLITSRGAGTSIDFGLALVRHLCGEESANQVANAIIA